MKRLSDSPPTGFVAECQRLLQARLTAQSEAEREDAEWALTFLFQMHKQGRIAEYFENRKEQG